MKFVFIYPTGSEYWTIQQRYLLYKKALYQRSGAEVLLLEGNAFAGKTTDVGMLCTDADMVVININASVDVSQIIQHWKARDKIVLIDLTTPVVLDSLKNTYQIGSSPLTIDKDRLIWILKLSDGVVVNSRQMLDDWFGITKVFYIPDYLDMDQYLMHPYEAHAGIRLGVRIDRGGFPKLAESGLLPALEILGVRYPQTQWIMLVDHPQKSDPLKNLTILKKTHLNG